MAIILLKDGEKVYFSETGLVTEEEKERADKIDRELAIGLDRLGNSFLKRRLITKEGKKEDALLVWFELGEFFSKVLKKFKLRGTVDEMYFWQAVYDHTPNILQKNPPPKNFRELSSNQYRKASIMAQYPWKIVEQVGRWAVWNDILDNPKILNDQRILDWIVKKVMKNPLPHKEVRKFLYAVSTRLYKIDTSVLNANELKQKLTSVDSI